MNAVAKGMLQASLVGLLAAAGPGAVMLTTAPAEGLAASPAGGPESRAQAPGCGGCRWELAPVSARHDGPGAASLRAATMLLDQCSGRTWILVSERGGLEWRALGREWLD